MARPHLPDASSLAEKKTEVNLFHRGIYLIASFDLIVSVASSPVV